MNLNMIKMTELKLQNWGLENIKLRPYQLEGIDWFINCANKSHGGILADEMGLGKTIQTISSILSFRNLFKFRKFIVISPLSVINNWETELNQFAPILNFIVYIGDKNNRESLQNSKEWRSENLILLTTYDYLMNDFEMINTLKLDVLFMDEGHRIKNNQTILFKRVMEMCIPYRFLLTGTPIQNNLDELYNLLYVVSPKHPMLISRSFFKDHLKKQLSIAASDSMFDCVMKMDCDLNELIMRRTKACVLADLPDKMEVIIFHGLTELQKKLYKACLTKEIGIFRDLRNDESKGDQKKLLNILTQIRKCVLHPYLFAGIEKEPFQLGEHVVENSAKMQVLDKLIKYLIQLKHKILVFSQMTKVLDIIQDFCLLRGYGYERLDGSVRCEERFAAISKFTESKTTKLFLLSTRAGGQGLNLTAADTVIFVDSDFNPQMDLQAMARIHRPGQERPCRTIRLVAKHSVEEMIVSRAQQKLVMTRTILGHEDNKENGIPIKVKEMLCYGLDKLFSSTDNESNLSNEFFTSILGETDDLGRWQTPKAQCIPDISECVDNVDHIYLFEGRNYKAKTDTKDYEVAADLAAVQKINIKSNDINKHEIKDKVNNKPISKKLDKKRQMWLDNKYESCKITLDSEDDDSDEEVTSVDNENLSINFLVGDVTNPFGDSHRPKVICQLVDNSGLWGSGGVFSSIDKINCDISIKYLEAAEMEDMAIGDTHIYKLTDNVDIALLVAQSRDKNERLSAVKMNSLEKCFIAIKKFAFIKGATVHLPRLGYKTPQFNWYGVEKLINKHLVEKGIETYVYYYQRNNKRPISPVISHSSKIIKMEEENDAHKKLSEEFYDSCLLGVVVYFDNSIDEKIQKELTKHVFAFDGDVSSSKTDCNITHYIFKEDGMVDDCVGSTCIKIEWLIKCIQQRSRLSEEKYKLE